MEVSMRMTNDQDAITEGAPRLFVIRERVEGRDRGPLLGWGLEFAADEHVEVLHPDHDSRGLFDSMEQVAVHYSRFGGIDIHWLTPEVSRCY
jgi:hypothetical protein